MIFFLTLLFQFNFLCLKNRFSIQYENFFQYHLASGYQLMGLSLNLSDFKYVLIIGVKWES